MVREAQIPPPPLQTVRTKDRRDFSQTSGRQHTVAAAAAIHSFTPHVTVVIPTFERPEQLRRCVQAALAQIYGPRFIDVVVVDDADHAATRAAVAEARRRDERVTYIAGARRGAAAARNAGARVASGQLLLFIDDDIILPPDGVARFVGAAALHPRACINGLWVFAPELEAALQLTPFGRFRLGLEEWVKRGMGTRPLAGGVMEPELLTACQLLIAVNDFWSIGGFDENFPGAGYEDQDLSLRAQAAGLQLVLDPTIVCMHDDRRLTRKEFLDRLERGAGTAVLMWRKHPSFFAERPLIRENDRPRGSDPPELLLKKLAKSVASTRLASVVLETAVRIMERVDPQSRLLNRLYWWMTGTAIYRGVRTGIARYGRPKIA